MQKKALLLITILLVIGLFIGNWIYGNILAKKIERSLTEKVALISDDVQLTIDKVNVNPLLSKLDFKGLEVSDLNGKMLFKSDEIILDMPYSEAMRILKSNRFEELKSFKMTLIKTSVYMENPANELLLDKLSMDFNGHITKEDIDQLEERFPIKKQAITINVEDIQLLDTKWMDSLGFTDEQKEHLSKVDEVDCDLTFNPDKKEFELRNLKLDSPLIEYTSNGTYKYIGDGLEGASPVLVNSAFELSLRDKGIEWGDIQKSGQYSLSDLSVKMDGEIEYVDGQKIVRSHSSNVLLEGLSIKFGGKLQERLKAQTAMLGMDMGALKVDRLAIKSSLKDDKLIIKNTELISSLLSAQINANVHVNQDNHKASEIIEAKVVVSDLVSGLQNALSTLELMSGQSLPREGEAIVLELNGSVLRPNIKGFKY